MQTTSGPYNCMYVGTITGLKEVNLTNKTVRTLLSKMNPEMIFMFGR